MIAILRLAVPYTGLILTAREEPALRREVLGFGVSQIDAGSRIELGGYTEAGDAQVMEREQFELGDIRQAAPYLEMGVKHFCIGWDVRILADWWDTKGAEMRGLLGGKTEAPAKPAVKAVGNY